MFIKFCGAEEEKKKVLFHCEPLHYEMNLPWTINLELYILLYLRSKLSCRQHSKNTNLVQNRMDTFNKKLCKTLKYQNLNS